MLIDALCAPETERLTLEITESLLVANKDLYRSFLSQAQGLGAKIALDDFGTGYSSLSYLRDYSFDVLKIDRSFISALDSAPDSNKADRNLVASIISLGEILNLEVVAEGVEEAEELRLLAELGCALIQGYYYGAPMPASKALNYLRNQKNSGILRTADQEDQEA
jgi:EAL domain-containing protein (putative c-di-GMP-specific phosphodiesterase class I)